MTLSAMLLDAAHWGVPSLCFPASFRDSRARIINQVSPSSWLLWQGTYSERENEGKREREREREREMLTPSPTFPCSYLSPSPPPTLSTTWRGSEEEEEEEEETAEGKEKRGRGYIFNSNLWWSAVTWANSMAMIGTAAFRDSSYEWTAQKYIK